MVGTSDDASLQLVNVTNLTTSIVKLRRLQLSAAARVGVPDVSSLALREPFVPPSPRRRIPKSPCLFLHSEQRLRARLAVVLAGSSDDSRESLLLKSRADLVCAAADTDVEE